MQCSRTGSPSALVVPMVLLYATRARALSRSGHAWVWGIVLVTLAMNLWWLLVAFRLFQRHFVQSFMHAGIK